MSARARRRERWRWRRTGRTWPRPSDPPSPVHEACRVQVPDELEKADTDVTLGEGRLTVPSSCTAPPACRTWSSGPPSRAGCGRSTSPTHLNGVVTRSVRIGPCGSAYRRRRRGPSTGHRSGAHGRTRRDGSHPRNARLPPVRPPTGVPRRRGCQQSMPGRRRRNGDRAGASYPASGTTIAAGSPLNRATSTEAMPSGTSTRRVRAFHEPSGSMEASTTTETSPLAGSSVAANPTR